MVAGALQLLLRGDFHLPPEQNSEDPSGLKDKHHGNNELESAV